MRITAVCDRASAKAMEARGDPLLNEVDHLVVCDIPEGSGAFRNRFIKTKVRALLDGSPLLYLDGDTFVQGDLSNLFTLDVDVLVPPTALWTHSKNRYFPTTMAY